MKKLLLLVLLIMPFASIGQVTTNPSPIEVDQAVTITVDITAGTCNSISSPTKVYAHLGIGNDDNPWGYDVQGNWGMDDGVGEMTDNGDDTWSITFTPNTYFNLTAGEEASATKMGMVFRNEDGSQKLDEDKGSECGDFFFNVGDFQVTMINPTDGSIIVNSGGGNSILATNTNGPADYELFANGVSINTRLNYDVTMGGPYQYFFSGINENQHCDLVVTQGGKSITKSFVILVNSAPVQNMAAGLVDGINYDSGDNTIATLVLDAPNKDFVYLAGSFPGYDWEPQTLHAMNKDASGKFWVELTGLIPGTNYAYQYWVGDATSLPANSSELVITADPYSTLILDPDDQYISSTNYPSIPSYPSGQDGAVTVLNTQEPSYSWQVANFTKPDKENLIVYEMHIRDFTESDSFIEAMTHLDYLETLGINAIELMPVSEFEGNDSWGYNPSFHGALDKAYGTKNMFKEFVDECHLRGIAVILDVVYNHAFSQSPLAKMYWDNSNSKPTSENPYLNVDAKHPFNVGYDFNHESSYTKNYVKQTLEYWIEEYKVDGFRFDLSKGFTQTNNLDNLDAWGNYDASRIAILQDYADFIWGLDSDSYLILEHFADNSEETVLANYGFMLWGNINHNFNQNTMGYSSEADISWLSYQNRGWNNPHIMGYMESHDEERLMVKNLAYGNSNGGYDVKNLNTALDRQETAAVIFYSFPGPKMLWQFGELGYDKSINCDGDIENDACRLDRKPVAWTLGYDSDSDRMDLYNVTSQIISLKKQYPSTFNTDNFALNVSGLVKRINLYDNVGSLDIVVVANFDVVAQNVNPNFPATGNWYEYFTEATLNVSNQTAPISLQPGEYRLYSQNASLSTTEKGFTELKLYPNPASNSFQITESVANVSVFDITGKLVKVFNGNFPARYEFGVSEMADGMYLIKIESFEGSVTKRLIIN